MIRFLADENVSRLVVERLRAGGFDVISIAETTPGAADKDVLEAADAEGRILITEDRDFGELVIRQRLRVRWIILLELDRLSNSTEAVAVAVVRLMQTISAFDHRQFAGGRNPSLAAAGAAWRRAYEALLVDPDAQFADDGQAIGE